MQFDVVALFPEIVGASLKGGVLGRAVESGLVVVRLHQLRQWGEGPHRRVDDYPYGGGGGMVLKPGPLFSAVEEIGRSHPAARSRTVLLGPQGARLSHGEAVRLSLHERLILLCGRYEGVDERVRAALVDEELSVGDYVLSGGEIAAAVVIDAVSRLVPGVVGNSTSVLGDSFVEGTLGVPQYTRPEEYRGMKVPEVLTSGDHARVEAWRRSMSRRNTRERRPDLHEAEGDRGPGEGEPGRQGSGSGDEPERSGEW